MGVATVGDLKLSVSGKKTFRSNLSTRNTNDWPLSDVSSDLTVEVGTSSFALHKFPLVSRSGRIRKLISESKDPKVTRINLNSIPGGAEAFELAAKFCYGAHVEITVSNLPMLRCAAHYLQMTEEFGEKNLESRTETFLRDTVLPDIVHSIAVLHNCEPLLPGAEEARIVQRVIAGIVTAACREQLSSGLSKLEQSPSSKAQALEPRLADKESTSEWWGMKMAILNLDLFQKVLSAMKSKGIKQDTISKIVMNYAHTWLQVCAADTPENQRRRRAIVEAMVALLPALSRKSPVPMAFLSGLLKAAVATNASNICRADLEKRIGMQLEQAILEDILIPMSSLSSNASGDHHHHHHPLYDADSVARMFSVFVNLDEEEGDDEGGGRGGGGGGEREELYDYDSVKSPKQSVMFKVSRLMDSFLAEVALDSNLAPAKFISLVELLPDHARTVNDGLYRVVDIFLKVHPNLKESERYRLCKAIDCRKLSQEACSHAAQNERLPVQMAVQVLYFEQIRLRNALNGNHDHHHHHLLLSSSSSTHYRSSANGLGSGAISPRDNYASVRRENRELKLEVARMRMRLTDLEKDHVSMKQELVKANPTNNLLKSLTKKLGKLNALFGRMRDVKGLNAAAKAATADARVLFQRRRRHSIS